VISLRLFLFLSYWQMQILIFSSLDIVKAIIAPESQFGHKMIHRINTDIDLISRGYPIDLQDQALERYSPVRINRSIES